MVEMDSTMSRSLVAASKVNGTTVYNASGQQLGTIDDIMIDKVSGRAIYAVMSFGGFLGIGDSYHPLPWAALKYNPEIGGYVINLDKDKLKNAPAFDRGSEFTWNTDYGRKIDDYYDGTTYW